MKLAQGIHDEHCRKTGCLASFTTANYGLTTTPEQEYEIATGRRPCPAVDLLDRQGACVRVVRPLEELKGLRLCVESGLAEDEILCVVCRHPTPSRLSDRPRNRSPPGLPVVFAVTRRHSPVSINSSCAKPTLKI